MDTSTVRNPYDWSIGESPAESSGGTYNWGMRRYPKLMRRFHRSRSTSFPYLTPAAISFMINQNATANATIDPSPIVFKFNGTDIYGNTMDPAADEFSGISLAV